ncbi:TPA: rRNA maturation RNase YbeY [Candidatus Daviesbacteria bacterium]|uniref:Putative rRNA maturation factor n=1 Tax=Candidatus Daviesbacteria bacterium GW2011_GWF2_38_6 TaxID=1618432 RepID=A0A0G0KTZ5_9BACT|nr:MAG: putative rRNA maturation factor [Candidatus Daviesbacteria bacterium GW2011_GWA2_38_17]KKQ79025.1 MAG: putative rRNA maturation factor [Candidatus Daviesbacteria bacterium GW2011_GWF2_38_6]OGE26068.1 MAG: rRNA maturation RNase YbeY [Candidatus Daviesbacteria bacterium RIFCSPHIGHO2_02_FULL_39_41]OGE44880.1 MAG: rRNA maturation RNase YbeY [Candidatus Daviesbacteria bacterium RIFCSPHIGHO2_12_FULL_38_25]OGE68087.1 MAG: rRNA maturation RNase YbeY [Candidatus Daviesbacteria bacterium RIFCSPLO
MINIIVSSDPRYFVNNNAIRMAVADALRRYRITGKVELGVSIIGDRKMHELNRKFRGIDSTTDILSFALEDPSPSSLQHVPRIGFVASPDRILRLGDIVISYPQVVEDASIEGISVEEEIRILVEHGVSHLLGVHH